LKKKKEKKKEKEGRKPSESLKNVATGMKTPY